MQKMERVDGDGNRRDIDPAEIAQYDQMEAHFDDLTKSILRMREQLKQAALADDTQLLGALTGEMHNLCMGEWPHAKGPEINYIMYLIAMIESAQDWTDRGFDIVGNVIRQLSAISRPGHPLHEVAGFDPGSLNREVEAVQEILYRLSNPETFVTDTGVKLHNVHAPDECQGDFCVIHHPAPGPWSQWQLHWREDWRLMVRICPHEVPHVAVEEALRMPLLGMIAHEHPEGCDCACDLTRCTPVLDDQGNVTGFQAIE